MVLKHQSHRSGHAHEEHKAHAPHCVTCVVITCSDTRTSQTDTSGQLMMRLLKEHGHELAGYHVIKDDPAQIRSVIEEAAAHDAVQAILVNGGTGISKRDSTFEAVDGMLEKRLVGFGEIFRYLTYKDIGSSAIMTRATAGIFRGRIIFSTPGSEGAVRLAMESLILPEIGHIIQQLNK
ncbi:MAG TPA: MogA/MoaB family molybdenum cofactor biosynthesis protein [Nitrospiraceae bacterium]|jgi:molybdenum cofactor biosynthesis protein B|nr:MogA/MoaB family molybdenum cofactor biosynthesis protein [Nitrospiraceae bacterium]